MRQEAEEEDAVNHEIKEKHLSLASMVKTVKCNEEKESHSTQSILTLRNRLTRLDPNLRMTQSIPDIAHVAGKNDEAEKQKRMMQSILKS